MLSLAWPWMLLALPLPFIARTQSKACKTLADHLHNFIVQEEPA